MVVWDGSQGVVLNVIKYVLKASLPPYQAISPCNFTCYDLVCEATLQCLGCCPWCLVRAEDVGSRGSRIRARLVTEDLFLNPYHQARLVPSQPRH